MSINNVTDENGTSDDPVSRVPVLDAINTIIACLAVLGNGMVITVMLLRRRVFSSFTNRLILHQSIIDCITGVVFFIQKVVRSPNTVVSVDGNLYDQIVCRIVASDLFLWCMNVTSTYNLVIISLERFMATCYPVKHRNTLTNTKLKIAKVTVWTIGFVYSSHLLFVLEAHGGRCRMIDLSGLKIIYIAVTLVMEYIVPITVIIYTYTRILIMIRQKLANPVNGQRNAMNKAKKNVLITTLLIGIMFVLCWTPIEVLSIVSGDIWNTKHLYTVITSLVAGNMFVNPIIYCFKYEDFRCQLKYLLIKHIRRNQVHNEVTITTNAQ